MAFVLILHSSLNLISPNLRKFSYVLALAEGQRLHRHHVMLVRWRVARCGGMHRRIYYSEFREVKARRASLKWLIMFASCSDEKSMEFFVTEQERIRSPRVRAEVKDMSSRKIAGKQEIKDI